MPISATVKATEEADVLLELEDGRIIRMPKQACEGSFEVGADVRIVAVVPGGEEAGKRGIAAHMLNELLGNGSEAP